MHNAAHTIKILDIVTSAWLIDFCHKVIQPCDLRSLLRNFNGRYQDLIEKYHRLVMYMVNDSFPGESLFYMFMGDNTKA